MLGKIHGVVQQPQHPDDVRSILARKAKDDEVAAGSSAPLTRARSVSARARPIRVAVRKTAMSATPDGERSP